MVQEEEIEIKMSIAKKKPLHYGAGVTFYLIDIHYGSITVFLEISVSVCDQAGQYALDAPLLRCNLRDAW